MVYMNEDLRFALKSWLFMHRKVRYAIDITELFLYSGEEISVKEKHLHTMEELRCSCNGTHTLFFFDYLRCCFAALC